MTPRTPILKPEIYHSRRQGLAKQMKGAALILPAQKESIRNHYHHYPYRQDSNLYYLTGFDEPESCLVYRPGCSPETVLFVRSKNPEREIWDGFRYGVEGAKQMFKVDEAYPIEDFDKKAAELLMEVDRLYYRLFKNEEFDKKIASVQMAIQGARPRGGRGILTIHDPIPLIGQLRVIKDEYDLPAMRKTCEISANAHVEMMKATKPGMTERGLHGVFLKSIMEQGASCEGYEGIIAGGVDSTCLHYVTKEKTLRDGEIVLVDCGAEYQFYSGDITRVWPVNGRFTKAQAAIYTDVLAAQKRLIQSVKPGVSSLAGLQDLAIAELTEIALKHGLLKGKAEEIIKNRGYLKYYPHSVSHYLGIDTHDAGASVVDGKPRLVEPGMVFTIEPGFYIPGDDKDAPSDYRGIGIRIEDDILVTKDACEVMTAKAPKEIEEIEALVGI